MSFRKHHLTLEQIDEIKHRHSLGETMESIAKKIGTTKQTVHNHVRGKLKGQGSPGRLPHWCPRVMTQALHQDLGLSITEIAELLQTSKTTVWQHLKKPPIRPQKLDERFEELLSRANALGDERRAIIAEMQRMIPDGDQD